MNWLELHIDTNHAGLVPLETFLSAHGIDGVIIDDETEFEEFLEHNKQYWDYVDEDLRKEKAGKSRITFYLEDNETGFAKLGELRIALSNFKHSHTEYGTLLMTMENRANEDWENNWKQFYKPMEIGNRLLVIPSWEEPKDTERVKLILNPGLTFGTGSHATTRLCLTALESRIHGGEKVLDLGCGSGILSIAALKLGADTAYACDIDDKVLDTTKENATLNEIDLTHYTVGIGDILTDQTLQKQIGTGYDVVLANIVSDVIIGLAPAVRSLLKEDGVFICSGIIDDRADEVAGALRAAGLTIMETQSSEGWFAYICQ